jgi:formylglycine-generating enzyme required for sulfatase activity
MFMTPLLSAKILTKLGIAALPLAALASPLQLGLAGKEALEIPTATIAARDFSYRAAGSFTRVNLPVNGPIVNQRLAKPLVIMKTQVSAADFQQCVRERACRSLTQGAPARSDLPAVGVSWEDATSYAKWLSAKTGNTWRLPTDAEWAFAAASRFKDDAIEAASDDFSQRWLAKYEQESERERDADRAPKSIGSYGANENGLLDIAGNVWEWTDTCFVRQSVDNTGRVLGDPLMNCGVRVVEGQHRTYVSNFIRDARAGGCSVGAPPSNLGFRLVREPTSTIAALFNGLIRRIGMMA